VDGDWASLGSEERQVY
jgi:hypothetical protein